LGGREIYIHEFFLIPSPGKKGVPEEGIVDESDLPRELERIDILEFERAGKNLP
jgi:hypothetical protein